MPNFGHRIADLTMPFSLFLASSLPQTEAHLPFHHYPDLGLGGDVRRDRPHPRHRGHDRVRPQLRQKVIDFDAHILVTSDGVMTNWRELMPKLNETPGVVATAPYIQGPVIIEFQNRRLAPMIRGIDPKQEEKVIPLEKFIKLGKLDLDGDSTVLGVELAQKLRITVGDKITVYSPGNLGAILDKLKELDKKQGEERTRRSMSYAKSSCQRT